MSEIVRTALAITLPWPPSVNSYWQPFVVPNTRNRVVMTLTPRAKLYRTDVHAAIRTQCGSVPVATITVPVRIDIELRAPDRRTRDIDNHIKGLFDALTHAGIWQDDSLVDEMTVRRGRIHRDGQANIVISALDPITTQE